MDYTKKASKEIINNTISALEKHGFTAELVPDRHDALEKIKTLIPQGASVMNGSSRTLEEIGYMEYLKSGKHSWDDLHSKLLAEKDQAKRSALRKQSAVSDYYLGSTHALSETGELIFGSNTGSQLPHLAFTSPNIILIVGTQKIVPSLPRALERLEKYVVPLENENMKQKYGSGTTHSKTLILHKENPIMGRKVHVILVNENLGF